MDLQEKIKQFPDSPGVYLMKDAAGEIIYVGKALSLRKRVRSYFAAPPPSIKTQVMLVYVRDLIYIPTPSEDEALFLESDLIKKHRPRFNISLKDDKSYPYIKITQEEFPRVFIGRRKKNETGYDYFGPYANATVLRRALKMLRKSFPFCTCRRFAKKPCLHYHLGLCPGPCAGLISRRAYQGIVSRLENFLVTRDSVLIEDLSVRMRRLVREERFEDAAKARDQLEALSLLMSLKRTASRKGPWREDDVAALGLKSDPRRIEAFDISNLYGTEAVGSMVSFFDGSPDKDNYRRFRIKTVGSIDDYAMMREVVRRRYQRLKDEGAAFPDLILIDGGAGHWEAARGVLKALGLDIPIIALAKQEELIYTGRHRKPLRLPADSVLRRLMERVRDEAHRFAVSYHRLLRKKKTFDA